MADEFTLAPPKAQSNGTGVTYESVQNGFNYLTKSFLVFVNTLSTQPPSGAAGGDLSGTYPNPTVAKVNGLAAGTMANQNANAVAITGGTIDGAVIGGTTPAAATVTSLAATGAVNFTANPLGITSGGTGSGTAAGARTNLGLGTIATQNANNVAITGGTVDNTPIGQTTAAAGSFTTLSASSSVSGTGFSNYLASPPAIGGTAPNAGAFTTLTASTAIGVASGGTGRSTLTAHGVIVGEGTGGVATVGPNASTGVPLVSQGSSADPSFSTTVAGLTFTGAITPQSTGGIVGTTTNDNANAGSVGEYQTATSASTGMTSGVNTNLISLSLTAGDWDVSGVAQQAPSGATVLSSWVVGISTVSGTFGPIGSYVSPAYSTTGTGQTTASPVVRVSLSATTTVYLEVIANFTTSTLNATGFIRARRIR